MKCNLDMLRDEGHTYLSDSPQLRDDREDSKFMAGTLMADGPAKRFEAHGHEILQKEVIYSRKAEADEAKRMNEWAILIRRFPKHSGMSCIFKTAEVRKAELEAILEQRL